MKGSFLADATTCDFGILTCTLNHYFETIDLQRFQSLMKSSVSKAAITTIRSFDFLPKMTCRQHEELGSEHSILFPIQWAWVMHLS